MRKNLYILAVMAIMAMAFSPTASATLQLTLSSGGHTFVVNDGGAGDANSATGQITFIGAVGNWILNVTTGTVGTNPLIDLSSVDTVSGNGTGSNALSLMFSATDYTLPTGSTFIGTIGGTLGTGHSLVYNAYVNANNALNGITTSITNLSFSNPPAGFNGSGAGGVVLANTPFSLTQTVVLSGTASGTSSFDANIDAVPEPATVVLLGGVLVATFSSLRRKRSRA